MFNIDFLGKTNLDKAFLRIVNFFLQKIIILFIGISFLTYSVLSYMLNEIDIFWQKNKLIEIKKLPEIKIDNINHNSIMAVNDINLLNENDIFYYFLMYNFLKDKGYINKYEKEVDIKELYE